MTVHASLTPRAKVVLRFRRAIPHGPISLYVVEFDHPQISSTIISYRGKSAGAFGMGASFQWSPAVRALSAFFLACALKGYEDSGEPSTVSYPFSGEEGSLAASLDYAISKRPLWLMEMFGSDSKGNSILRKLVQRSNAERRFGGPVSISLNTSVLGFSDIEIWLNDRQVSLKQELGEMLAELNGGEVRSSESEVTFKNDKDLPDSSMTVSSKFVNNSLPYIRICNEYVAAQRLISPLPQLFSNQKKFLSLAEHITTEIRRSLSYTDIFSRANYNNLVRDIFEQPALKGIVKAESVFSSTIDRELAGAARLGFVPDKAEIHETLVRKGPLRVSIPFLHAASILILKGLRHFRGIPVEVDFNYVHTTELAQTLQSSAWSIRPDVVILNLPAVAHLYSSETESVGDYIPLMLLPCLSHAIVAPLSSKSEDLSSDKGLAGEYHFMGQQIPTVASCFFENLRASRMVNMKRSRAVETELCDVFAELNIMKPETRVIMPAPLLAMLKVYSSCNAIEIPGPDYSMSHAVLLIHRDMFEDQRYSRALDICIRDMWMELRDSSILHEIVIGLLLNDQPFLSILSRVSGIRNGTLKPMLGNQ